MIRLAVAGATGHMGRCVLELASRDNRFDISAALTEPGCSMAGSAMRFGDKDVTIVETLETPCDVLIDFTVAAATDTLLGICLERELPMVIGATGHNDEQLARIREAARSLPILKSTNFSIGINAILGIVSKLVKELGEGYDVEIVETHHRNKIDAPSGTALALADEILAATSGTRKENVIFGRSGQAGRRPSGQIGVHAMRMGDMVSRHEVHLSGPGETVTLQHTSHSRDTFAAGALRAAAWIVGKKAGFYTMRHVGR